MEKMVKQTLDSNSNSPDTTTPKPTSTTTPAPNTTILNIITNTSTSTNLCFWAVELNTGGCSEKQLPGALDVRFDDARHDDGEQKR